jgi:hypothetical protein
MYTMVNHLNAFSVKGPPPPEPEIKKKLKCVTMNAMEYQSFT